MRGRLARSRALMWLAHTRAGRFIVKHEEGEEVVALAISLDVVWSLLLGGILGAGIACAATLSTSTTYHPSFVLSQKGAAFLTRNEGLRLSPYNDPYNCTVGVGHLIHYGPCSSGDYSRWRITFTQAMNLLMHDSGWASRCVDGRITRHIAQYQADALTDLAFNAGCGSLDYSGIARTINGGGARYVPGILSRTAVTASGHYLSGLYTRRLAEGRLFAHGYYGAGIGYFVAPKPLTAAQKRILTLRHRTGYFSWLGWYLGEGAWKPYHRQNPKVRPHVPARVLPLWWRRERAFVKARA